LKRYTLERFIVATKSKITFVLPESLQNEMREKIIKDGYGLRGKSKWVNEAIELLLNTKDYIKLVEYNDELRNFKKVETIVLDSGLEEKLNTALVSIRKAHPTLEGVKSKILRTAILQRLLRFVHK